MGQGWNGGGRVAGRGLMVKWGDSWDGGGESAYGVGSAIPRGGVSLCVSRIELHIGCEAICPLECRHFLQD